MTKNRFRLSITVLLAPLLTLLTLWLGSPAVCFAQEHTAVWDASTIRILESQNVALLTTDSDEDDLGILPVLINQSEDGGSFIFSVETSDGMQSKLIMGAVGVDGATELTVFHRTIFDAHGTFAAGIPGGHGSASSWSGWSGYWDNFVDDYVHYLTHPWDMDDDLEVGFYIAGGVGAGAAVAAGGVVVAGVGGTVITGEMITGAGIIIAKEVGDELVDRGVSAATGGVIPGLPTSASDIVEGIAKGGVKKIIKRRAPKGTFIDDMTPAEAARYEKYWKQGHADTPLNTRQREYTAPGTRIIRDEKISTETGGLYTRETIYDDFGRRIGNNDFTDHGRPNVHPNPHHHPNTPFDPKQHGPVTPGIHPLTPRR
ncbi:MAG: hypothetical protein FJ308_11860 [Planctomycetes bacterium]|nr:hypothetical protein [Planctomycetota bacterium]